MDEQCGKISFISVKCSFSLFSLLLLFQLQIAYLVLMSFLKKICWFAFFTCLDFFVK